MTKLSKPFHHGAMYSLSVVNVHQAKTHLSRLIDDAHAGETICSPRPVNPGRG